MEQMYQDYKDIAEFYIVYISEAHAEDGRRPVPYAKELGIKEHKTYGERCSVAARLTKDKKLTIPCLIDDMDDTVDGMYHGHPDRVFLVRRDGKLGVAGKRGPFGFKPALDKAQDWLAEYKRTGTEPEIEIPADEYDVGEAQRELSIVYERGDYDKALKIAKKISEAEPKSSAHMYNVACMYCLVGSQDKGIEWLEKTVNAGWEDAEHILQDDDFTSIRETDAFKGLVERARQNKKDRLARRVTSDAAKVAVGRWTMKTMMRDQEFESGMAIRFDDGFLVGTWTTSRGDDVEMEKLTLDGDKLTFERTMMRDMVFKYEGTIDGDEIDGQFDGEMGTLDSNGKRISTDPKAPIEKNKTDSAKIDSETAKRIIGRWEMATEFGGQKIDAVMTLSVKDGRLTGVWASMGREMEMSGISFDGTTLSFKRSMGPDQELSYKGVVKGDKLEGKYSGPMGELESNGERRDDY